MTLGRPVRVIRRDDFDASLVAQARDLGIEVRERTPLAGFTVDGDGVDIGVGQGDGAQAGTTRLRARVLVGAEGVGSRVRKHLNGESDGTPIRLFRLEVPARGAWRSDAMLYDFSPMTDGLRGYLWVFPVDGDRLNVGLMHDPSVALSGGELESLLQRHLGRLGITLPRAARGWPAFGYHPSAPIGAPHLLTVGDAAGIDALTGEGIAVGMEQALVAGRRHRARARRRRLLASAATPARCAAPRSAASWRSIAGWRGCSIAATGSAGCRSSCATSACSSSTPRASQAALVLADHKRELVWALMRHVVRPGRTARLTRASASAS